MAASTCFGPPTARFLFDFITWAAFALGFCTHRARVDASLVGPYGKIGARGTSARFAADFILAEFGEQCRLFCQQGKWFPIARHLARPRWHRLAFPHANRSCLFPLDLDQGFPGEFFVLFYAGGYHYGASSRYAVVSCAPIAVAMGIGAASLWDRFAAKKRDARTHFTPQFRRH